MSARLICRSGELSGSRFELGPDTVIGRDAAKRIVVVPSGDDVAARLVRIHEREGGTFLEALQPGSVTLDGAAVTGPSRLDRMHVIGVEGIDFVFSRSAAAVQPPAPPPSPAPPAPAPPTPVPPPEPEPAPQADAGHTVVDMVGFGALPELGADRKQSAGPSGDAGDRPADAGPPAEAGPPADAGRTPADAGHTVVDMAGFGMLPDLPRTPRRESGTPRRESAAPPARQEPAPQSQPDRVTAREADATPAPHAPPPGPTRPAPPPPAPPVTPRPPAPPPVAPVTAPPADADATVQMPALVFELEVNVPGQGPAKFVLNAGDNIIGRGADCDIPIHDPEMWLSRKHANVRVSVDQIELIDLQGRNGTYVKGQRIDRAVVTPGSTFVLGPHLEFKLQQR